MTQTQHITGQHSIRWIKAYLECLFENREHVVLVQHKRQLELFLM
jgi:hypothetical protein